jgi:hypothetical protein
VPILVTVVGIGWVQASAWRATEVAVLPRTGPRALWPPLVALAAMLAICQLVLRPGLAF